MGITDRADDVVDRFLRDLKMVLNILGGGYGPSFTFMLCK